MEVGGHLLEHSDEGLPDDATLPFGVGHVMESLDEAVGRLDVHEVDLELAPERLLDLIGLVHT